jgi:predicted nucleic acid-binding protein
VRILVDTNVIIDVLIEREPFKTDSARVVSAAQSGLFEPVITSSSLTDVYYIIRKKLDARAAAEAIRAILEDFDLIHIDKKAAIAAIDSGAPDLEDAMQCQAALANGCVMIITRDSAGYPDIGIPTLTPSEFIRKTLAG